MRADLRAGALDYDSDSDVLVRKLEESGFRFDPDPEWGTTQPRAGASLEFARAEGIRNVELRTRGFDVREWDPSALLDVAVEEETAGGYDARAPAAKGAEGRDRTGKGAAMAGSAQGWVDGGLVGGAGHGRAVNGDATEGHGCAAGGMATAMATVDVDMDMDRDGDKAERADGRRREEAGRENGQDIGKKEEREEVKRRGVKVERTRKRREKRQWNAGGYGRGTRDDGDDDVG
ncbi:hypothetical protein DFH09DRAFT_1099270 [Mycena vulgaris]|nr:hypothetical protein DFH09DRAFT_1099270 [Mycena vulgaris]